MNFTPVEVYRSILSLNDWRESLPPGTIVGFVPTMGALHAGHARLLDHAKSSCDRLVLSIYVNPTQFAKGEDLDKYPRTLESDLKIAQSRGVDAVFAPTSEEMYPSGYSTWVKEDQLSKSLCGQFRPGHFDGVATVVLKLFNIVRPDFAVFGLKDAQQFCVLRKMIQDLNLGIRLEGVPTVRESSGLALSSRNQYLSPAEREIAPFLYRTLQEAAKKLQKSFASADGVEEILKESRARLEEAGFKVQYLDYLGFPDLSPISKSKSSERILAVAAYLGATRLIDNIVLK